MVKHEKMVYYTTFFKEEVDYNNYKDHGMGNNNFIYAQFTTYDDDNKEDNWKKIQVRPIYKF